MRARYPPGVRTYILASFTGAIGAVVGAVVMLLLKVGANTNCLDLIQRPISAACAVPTAAPRAVAIGAASGAVLAVVATAVVRRQRR